MQTKLSFQRRLSPQPTNQLTAVVIVRDRGQWAFIAHHHFAPSARGFGATWRRSDAGAAFAAAAAKRGSVLASDCGLLLAAIAIETCSSQGEARTRKKKLCGHSLSSTHSNPDEFSEKNSGRGDSESNDSSSDISIERASRKCLFQ
ncbi:hypothetical protein PRBEI_2000019400 [Prionailurus iriomotensis]